MKGNEEWKEEETAKEKRNRGEEKGGQGGY
jgi:hypothetical protein